MPKERDLVDYLKLGNDLIQTSQLSAIRQAQKASVILGAARLEADQRDSKARLREDNIREFVFSADKLVQGIERLHATSNPGGTLVTLYELVRYIDEINVKTTSVRTYEDKERVHAFLEKINRIIGQCEGRLDSATLRDVKICVKFKAEQINLKELLCYKARQRLVEQHEPLSEAKTPEIAMKRCDYCGRESDCNAVSCAHCGQGEFQAVSTRDAQKDYTEFSLDDANGLERFKTPVEKPVLLRFFAIFAAIVIPFPLLIVIIDGSLPPILKIGLAVGAAMMIFILAKYGADKPLEKNTAMADELKPGQSARQELALIMDRQRAHNLEKEFGAGDFDYYKNEFLKRTGLISKVMGCDDSESNDNDFLRNSCAGEKLLNRTPNRDAPLRVFGNDIPGNGWLFSGSNGLGDFTITPGLNPVLDTATQRGKYIEFLINRGYTLCFKTSAGITIFTRLKLSIAPEGVEALRQTMGMTPATMVDYNGRVESAAAIFASSTFGNS